MNYETVVTDIVDDVGYIKMNRIKQRNALNSKLLLELTDAFQKMEINPNVKVIVLRSSCEGVFSAGADLKERKGMNVKSVKERRLTAKRCYEVIESCEKPIIVEINGKIFGGGYEIASTCDIIIASDNSTFNFPEVKWGSVGVTQRMPRFVGKHIAKDLLLTARTIDADEALRIGLVTRVIPRKEISYEVDKIARTIASFSSESVRLTKKCINISANTTFEVGVEYELAAIEICLGGTKWKEGVNAFMNR